MTGILAGDAPRAADRGADERRQLHGRRDGGQKTGPVLRPARQPRLCRRRLARGARVLDVFSHVGGFALACPCGGGRAGRWRSMLPSRHLALARGGGAEAGGMAPTRLETRAGDAFATLEALAEEGAQFDLVICDPPAFAPSKEALEKKKGAARL